MQYENKPGTGALFKRDKKSDKAPDYAGPFYEEIGGEVVEREIAAWVRKSKKGTTFLSVKVGDKFVPRGESRRDDDIPF